MIAASDKAVVLNYIRAKYPNIRIGEIAFNSAIDADTLDRYGIEVEQTELIVDELVKGGILIQCEAPALMYYLITEEGHRLIYANPF